MIKGSLELLNIYEKYNKCIIINVLNKSLM